MEIDPDLFYYCSEASGRKGDKSFIYYKGHLFVDDCDVNHYEMIGYHYDDGLSQLLPSDFNDYIINHTEETGGDDMSNEVRDAMNEDGAIFGRTGMMCDGDYCDYIISTWQVLPDYKKLYSRLRKHLNIPADINEIWINTPNMMIPLSSGSTIAKSAEEQERHRKQMELHLMAPGQKKQVMRDLGLATGGKKHAYQDASEKYALVSPGQKWWAPSSEGYFNKRLNVVLESYLNPDAADNLESPEKITFIYLNDNLYATADHISHTDIIRLHYDAIKKDIIEIYKKNPDGYSFKLTNDNVGEAVTASNIEHHFGLTGRTCLLKGGGDPDVDLFDDNLDKYIITFWSDNSEIFSANVRGCAKAIIPHFNHKDLAVYLSSAITGLMPIKQAMETEQHDDISDEEKERIRLQHKLHLMNPKEKRAAMIKLGLAPGGKKHEYQDASEKAGVVRPGQKWWAANSESYFNKRLNILEDQAFFEPNDAYRIKEVMDSRDKITFIYINEHLYVANGYYTHDELVKGYIKPLTADVKELFTKNDYSFQMPYVSASNIEHNFGLSGRTFLLPGDSSTSMSFFGDGVDRYIIAFHEGNDDLFDEMGNKCIEAVKKYLKRKDIPVFVSSHLTGVEQV